MLPTCSAQRVRSSRWTLASLLLALVLTCNSTSVLAQFDDHNLVVGARINQNRGAAEIQTFSTGIIACGTFTEGSALRPSFFAGLRLPRFYGLGFTPYLEYRDLSSNFTLTPDKRYHVANTSLEREQVTFERTFEGSASALYLGSEIELFNVLGFGLGIAPAIGVPLSTSYFERESITSDNAYYLPSLTSTIETRTPGELPFSLLADIGIVLSTNYKLKNGVTVGPSVRLTIPLVGLGSDKSNSWSVTSMSAGLAFGYDPDEPEQLADVTPIVPETVTPQLETTPVVPQPKRSILTATISAVGINFDGTEVAEPTLTIERIQVTEAIPTLNYVFFSNGSTKINERYSLFTDRSAAKDFDERLLFASNAEAVHRHILNIIGSRLVADKQATITLVGTRSNSEESGSALTVSKSRAESIANYLKNVWGIASNRIKIQPRQLPENPSDDQTPHGREENQRVEIIPSKPSIVAPLWAYRVERVATPPSIRFGPDIIAEADVVSATIEVRQGDQVLQTFDALNSGLIGERLWRLTEGSMPGAEDSLVYELIVQDIEGNEARASGSIKLRQVNRESSTYKKDSINADRKVEKYSLILFDYSSSDLAKNQADTIINYVAKAISPKSRLVITGHTDKTGNDAFNEQLAGQRAARAAELLDRKLRALRKQRPDMSVESHGSRDILFDNSLPEGRFLSRTVRVTVEEDLH